MWRHVAFIFCIALQTVVTAEYLHLFVFNPNLTTHEKNDGSEENHVRRQDALLPVNFPVMLVSHVFIPLAW